jgi:non-ribosomal peptide synthetase component F
VVIDWNRTEKLLPKDKCVHLHFQAHAASTPNALALVDGDVSFTYGQLNARANRFANYLRKQCTIRSARTSERASPIRTHRR